MSVNKKTINFILNGKKVSAETTANENAVQFLREKCNQKSVKEGCGIGECGACTIIVNGKAVNSCLMSAPQLDNCVVETTEGLSEDGKLHPLQESFIKHNAIQCGYCSPGFLMNAKALLDENPKPKRSEVKKALAGNVCRCTGYQQIVDAVLDAAGTLEKEDK